MPRYYRTSSPRPVDYAYKINSPLMGEVILKNDQYIADRLNTTSKIDELANYDHLAGDEADALAITKQYQDQAAAITDQITKDPANWRKQTPAIDNLKRKLLNDYKGGAISKQAGNYQRRKTDFDRIDKQVELYYSSGGDKGIDPNRAMAWKAKFDSKFSKTGYDPANPTKYNIYQGGMVMDNIDIKKVLGQGLDKIKSDQEYRYREDVTGQGWYFNKLTNKEEAVTPEKVLQVATDNINPQLLNYLKGEQEVGLLSGVTDQDGNFISPYSYRNQPASAQEQAQLSKIQGLIDREKSPKVKEELRSKLSDLQDNIRDRKSLAWDERSPLTAPLRSLVGQHSWRHSESGNDLSNNAAQSTIYNANQAWGRQSRELQTRLDLHKDTQDRLDQRLKDKFDNDIELQKLRNEGKIKAPTSGKAVPPPIETGISKHATLGLESRMTDSNLTPNKKVHTYSNEGLTSDIANLKVAASNADANAKVLEAQLQNDPNNGELQLKLYNAKMETELANGELNDRRKAYGAAREVAIAKLTPEEKIAFNEYAGKDENFTGLTKKIKQLEEKYPKIVVGEREGTTTIEQSGELVSARKQLKDLISIRNKVNAGSEKFLDELRAGEFYDTDTIVPTAAESEAIKNVVINNPQDLQIFDAEGKKPTKALDLPGMGNIFNPSSDDKIMTFDQGQLSKYIQDTDTKMIVEDFGPTTKLGNGNAVLKVRFEDSHGEIPKDKSYYIVLGKQQQSDVASMFRTHKNKGVADIANRMVDPASNMIRNQMANVRANKEFTIFVDDIKGNKVPFYVTRVDKGNELLVKARGDDGQLHPLPSLGVDSTSGIFANVDHLVASYKALMAKEAKEKEAQTQPQ